MRKKRILFVVNPIAGGKEKLHLPSLIARKLDLSAFDAQVVFSEKPDHAYAIARQAVDEGHNIIVAVGGDGTLNEVARAVMHTNTAIAVIPFGSGNGLARHLKIPLNIGKALASLNNQKTELIDAISINGEYFFNMAGVGFDAHISRLFANKEKRGFKTYLTTTFRELLSYGPSHYKLMIDDKIMERDAFMISFANSSQFGNDAHIAPHADLQDGLVDVCIVKRFPLITFPLLAYRMITNTVEHSRYLEIIKGKQIIVERLQPGPVHLDGEPKEMGRELHICMHPQSLKILTP